MPWLWRTMDGGLWHCTGGSDEDHGQEKEMQKAKMVVWGGLTNSWEKKRAEGKGEKERSIHLNAEFKRIARRDKAFISDKCKEIEENNRMVKTGDLFKKIRDTKGTFHCKDGLNKGQKWYGPNRSRGYQEVARIHRRTIQKKIFMTQITTMVQSLT